MYFNQNYVQCGVKWKNPIAQKCAAITSNDMLGGHNELNPSS